jgi:hypothetical protein
MREALRAQTSARRKLLGALGRKEAPKVTLDQPLRGLGILVDGG